MRLSLPTFTTQLNCPRCNSSPIVNIPVTPMENHLIYCIDCDALFLLEETGWVWIEIPKWAKKLIRINAAYSKTRLEATTLKELAPYYEKEYFEGITISAYDGCKRNMGNIVWEHCIIEEGVQTVLEVGCAYGHDVKALRNRGIKAIGIDISKYAVKKRRTNAIIRASITHLPFQNNSFELVWSISMLEHIPEKYMPQTINELRRVGAKQLHILSILQTPLTGDITHVNEKPLQYWLKLTSWEHVELEKSAIILLCFGFQNLTPTSLLKHYTKYAKKNRLKEATIIG